MSFPAMIMGHRDRETATLIRAAAPVKNASGVYEAATPAESQITLVTHPVSPETADKVPEADRATALIEIYSTQVLFVARDSQAADRIRRADGKTYRVATVDEQKQGVWLAFAALEEPTA